MQILRRKRNEKHVHLTMWYIDPLPSLPLILCSILLSSYAYSPPHTHTQAPGLMQ